MAHQQLGRLLLQEPAGACQQQLAGVGIGGWIALSLFIGIFIGSTSTLLVQCWRRRREFRYMDKGTSVRQSMVMMQSLPPAPRTPVSCTQPAALPAPLAATPNQATVQGGSGANKQYFSPLNTNKGHGSVAMVHAQLSEMRSSIHLSSDNGGDLSVAASDQQAHRDKTGAAAGQVAASAGSGQREREFSQHGMRLQQRSSRTGAPAAADWSSAVPAQQGSGPAHPGTPGLVQAATGNAAYAAGMQLPQELSSDVLSADGPLHAEDSSPAANRNGPAAAAAAGGAVRAGSMSGISQAPPAQPQQAAASGAIAAAAAGAAGIAPSPRQQARLPNSPEKGAAVHSTSDGKQTPSPSTAEIEDEYEDQDLDDDWRALLGGVDARLKLQGARPMDARERAVAIKKLLVATGTRGVEFALNSTIQEVLNFRQLHGH